MQMNQQDVKPALRGDVRTARGPQPRATHSRRQRLLTVAGGTLAALFVWAVAEWVVGLDLRTPALSSGQRPQELTAALVAVAGAVGGLAGWGALAVLERFSMNADRVWVAVALIALLTSIGAPLSGYGVSAGNRIALIGMHLAVAAVVIPFLYRSSASRRDRRAP